MEQNLKILISLAMMIYSSILPGLSLAVETMNTLDSVDSVEIAETTETEAVTEKATEAAEPVVVVSNATEQEYVVFTENNIKTQDMRKKSRLDEKTLTEYMKKFPYLSGIEGTLIKIQEDYDVNAVLILAIVRIESGNGKSSAATSRNNLGGLIVMQDSVRVFKSFDSKDDCLIYMANLLANHYLSEGGKFFNGYTLSGISKKYCEPPTEWVDLVAEMMLEIQRGIGTGEN